MPNDPDKQPVDSPAPPVCPLFAVISGSTWTVCQQGNVGGLPTAGIPVWNPISWAALGPIPVADPAGPPPCIWFLDTNPAVTPTPQTVVAVQFQDIGSGPQWVITCFNTTNAVFAGVDNAISTYTQPVGNTSPVGTYTPTIDGTIPDPFSVPSSLALTV